LENFKQREQVPNGNGKPKRKRIEHNRVTYDLNRSKKINSKILNGAASWILVALKKQAAAIRAGLLLDGSDFSHGWA